MKVNDYLTGAPFEAPELADEANPFQHDELLIEAQITRIVVDVMSGTVGVLLELRQAPQFRATTALLRVTGVAQQNWICAVIANEFTAWSITGATVFQREGEFQLIAQCLPAGSLRIVGASAEFFLLESDALGAAPLGSRADARDLIRFGVAYENTECVVVGVARSSQTERV